MSATLTRGQQDSHKRTGAVPRPRFSDSGCTSIPQSFPKKRSSLGSSPEIYTQWGRGPGVCVSSTFSGAAEAPGPGSPPWEPAPGTPQTPRSRAGGGDPGWGAVGSQWSRAALWLVWGSGGFVCFCPWSLDPRRLLKAGPENLAHSLLKSCVSKPICSERLS